MTKKVSEKKDVKKVEETKKVEVKKDQASNKKETNKAVKKKVDISPFISNPEGNIYAVAGLPEEFIATMFAWVSRSPKSFKEHLADAIEEFDIKAPEGNPFKALDKKAADFHKKWTVDYGHASVSEHAIAHVGIEKISRLASAELELSNTFLSITEYSQRYQKPKRGDWYNPFKGKTEEHKKFEAFMNEAFDTFEELTEKLHAYLDKSIDPSLSKAEQKKISNANLKLAFEDARYVLPLAMYTQLGMTANGRAWRDALANLETSNFKESIKLKDDLKKEISKVLPTLLRHADASDYQKKSKKYLSESFDKRDFKDLENPLNVRVLSSSSEREALQTILSLHFLEENNISLSSAMSVMSSYSLDKLKNLFSGILKEMKHFDVPPESFKFVNYDVELFVSEANWHQLLRHNRKTNFIYSDLDPIYGVKIPPRIKEAGLVDLFTEIEKKSADLYKELQESLEDKSLAQYVALNAHKRRVVASFDLWEAYHLINLRTTEEAQWDIRETMEEMYQILSNNHPTLFSMAKRKN